MYVTLLLSSALSQLPNLCVDKLLLTPHADNLSEKCQTKLRLSYALFQHSIIHNLAGATDSPNGSHKLGSNLLPSDERAGTLTTQPIQLASRIILAGITN